MPQHLALPLTITGTGGLAAIEQDSALEIAQSVALLLDTRPGERRSVPDYGALDMVAVGLDPEAIAATIEEFEPRADPATIELVGRGIEEHAVVRPAAPLTASATGEDLT